MLSSNLLKILGISFLGTGIFACVTAPVSAMSLVPQVEGEINVGFNTAMSNSYIQTPGFTVTSLVDSSTQTKSRLFVDRAGTNNTYGGIQFLSKDIGTSEASNSYWFRPVAMMANGITPMVEKGQLEVGSFLFNFTTPVKQMVLRLFDTEFKGGTGFSVNGGSWSAVPAGANNNIFEVTLNDVNSLTLNLGERYGATGDGVNFQISSVSPTGSAAAVPEPTTMVGLALAGAGFVGARRRRSSR